MAQSVLEQKPQEEDASILKFPKGFNFLNMKKLRCI